jgi:hypothetical protein
VEARIECYAAPNLSPSAEGHDALVAGVVRDYLLLLLLLAAYGCVSGYLLLHTPLLEDVEPFGVP